MARQIVTQDVVDKAAEALVAEGLEPSIVAIQARAGGGSFSTVKRYLDIWKQRRAEAAAAAPETPPPIRAKAEEFARAAWALAYEEAQQETRQAKALAAAEIAALRAELAEANTEIARLEANEVRLNAAIARNESKLRDAEVARAEFQAQANRIPEIETALDGARQEVTQKAVEVGKLTGEAESLRAQLHDLMAVLKPIQESQKT